MFRLFKYTSSTIFFLFINALVLEAQDSEGLKHRISTSLYKLETIIEPINGNTQITRLLNGIYYQYSFSLELSAIAGFEYGEKGVNDNCIDCPGQYYGKGLFEELSILLGIRYNPIRTKFKSIYPILQVDLYYSSSYFTGNYNGGITTVPYHFKNIYDKFGIIGKIGVEAQILKNVYIDLLTGYRSGKYAKEEIFQHNSERGSYSNWMPLEIIIGIGF